MISMVVVGKDGKHRVSVAGRRAIASLRGGFFNRDAVIQALDAAEFVALQRSGAYVRRVAQNLIKRRRTPSPPGQPPSSREGETGRGPWAGFLDRSIEFAYDRSSRSVLVGPIGMFNSGVPRVHEFGGTLRIRNPRRRKRSVGGGGPLRIVSPGTPGRTVKLVKDDPQGRAAVYAKLFTTGQVARAESIETKLYGPMEIGAAKYPARPYMRPALSASAPHIAKFFEGAVRL